MHGDRVRITPLKRGERQPDFCGGGREKGRSPHYREMWSGHPITEGWVEYLPHYMFLYSTCYIVLFWTLEGLV